VPGARSTPGGQLIQATDQFVGTRGARLVLLDDEGVRAPVVAARLRQMGWDAAVLADPTAARALVGSDAAPLALPQLRTISAAELARDATLLDLRPSAAYRAGHLAGALWTIRPVLAGLALPPGRPVVLVADAAETAQLATIDLAERGIAAPLFHRADLKAWAAAGLTVAATPQQPPDAACIDFLFFTHDRHSGNKDAARQYLAWETNLLSQLDPAERATFRI
jgi:rhodanese-related sulfurtransferase